MCKEAKIEGQLTNHSMHATDAIEFFRIDVPEEVIQGLAEHWLIKFLRQYEKSSMHQEMGASNVLVRCDEECSTSGITRSTYDIVSYKSSLPSVSSRSDLIIPAYSTTMQFPSFAPVLSNQGTVYFIVNI